MPSRSIIRTGVGPHREPGNRFPAMAAINLLAARAARVQSRRNLSRSLSPKLDHSHSIARSDRSRTGPYARTKAAGEAVIRQARSDAVIFRPSLVFGPGDSFFNRFASLARGLPMLPLARAYTRFHPVYAADVSEAIGRAVDGQVAGGQVYELGGPESKTLRELVEYMLA